MKYRMIFLFILSAGLFCPAVSGKEADLKLLEEQFRELPMDARRLTGPLFWLHGDESKERLEFYVQKIAEGGNGTFTAESRPHNDWLGKGWYRDLQICLESAKKNNLTMWIFDEQWWPSQMVAGRVPPQFGCKTLEASEEIVTGPAKFSKSMIDRTRLIAILAGRDSNEGIDGESIVDLTGRIKDIDNKVFWEVPAGKWKIMTFTWRLTGEKGFQQPRVSVDGASKDCVDWFLRTVYQPHYDRFKNDFGRTIQGFFYDEPETQGDWGTEVRNVFDERKVDWKKALVAYKFRLKGDDNIAGCYQYLDAFAEAWGRTMYGGMSKWCSEHNVVSMGHFMEHENLLFDRQLCAGNMFGLQKYSDMGGIDLVCRQFYPGQRIPGMWQMAKLGSSVAHVYNKKDDLAMCEIFGGYEQDLTYPQMKLLTDQMQVRGTNFMIPHSFNPRSPYDKDFPPYFYNGGFEPRWPLYRVYADYTSRISLLFTGGRHICPIAFLFIGQSYNMGKTIRPDEFTDSIQDALYDCDWMPYEVLENDCRIKNREIKLYDEAYRVLIVPPAEVVPYETMLKAKEFFDKGGVVIGYGFLPTKSATIGYNSKDISRICKAIWGSGAKQSLQVCRTNRSGGRSYFLAEKPSADDVRKVLKDSGVEPVLDMVEGLTNNWVHVLHRVKAGCDVFLICNQNLEGGARKFRFRIQAEGFPECWDAMRNEITALNYKRDNRDVEFSLTLEPAESAIVVFNPKKRYLPLRLEEEKQEIVKTIEVTRDETFRVSQPQLGLKSKFDEVLAGCSWVWYPEGSPAQSTPPGVRYFRKKVEIPSGSSIKGAKFVGTADNDFTLFVNGKEAGKGDGSHLGWQNPVEIEVTSLLVNGENQIAIMAVNATDSASPAGLIGKITIEFNKGEPLVVRIDKTWNASNEKKDDWAISDFNDADWPMAMETAKFGEGPWGRLNDQQVTMSPVKANPFFGRCLIAEDLDLKRIRAYLEMNEINPEPAARITVNDKYAGGFIEKPLRLEVTGLLHKGENKILIEPFTPESVRIVLYP